MSPLFLTLMIFAIMLVLMAIRVPIAIAMFVAGCTGYVVQAGWPRVSNCPPPCWTAFAASTCWPAGRARRCLSA